WSSWATSRAPRTQDCSPPTYGGTGPARPWRRQSTATSERAAPAARAPQFLHRDGTANRAEPGHALDSLSVAHGLVGEPVLRLAEYAKERRLFLPIQAVPKLVVAAFLSAEDKNFYKHVGVDPEGVARAVKFFFKKEKGQRPQGASTITQQVAKNFLLSNEATV